MEPLRNWSLVSIPEQGRNEEEGLTGNLRVSGTWPCKCLDSRIE